MKQTVIAIATALSLTAGPLAQAWAEDTSSYSYKCHMSPSCAAAHGQVSPLDPNYGRSSGGGGSSAGSALGDAVLGLALVLGAAALIGTMSDDSSSNSR